jgi:hypothetical protein
MFVIESGSAKAARKMSVLMVIGFILTGKFGAGFTMHFYRRPSGKPARKGARIFGFQISCH